MTSYVEISESALRKNVSIYRKLIGKRIFCGVVKANAYGHGATLCTPILDGAGVDWFGVNSVEEASTLRKIGVRKPVYILGSVHVSLLADLISLNCRIVVYNKESILALSKAAKSLKKKIPVHLKLETGNFRQGVCAEDAVSFARLIVSQDSLFLEGISTHFSNIEDTTDHSYADLQIQLFKKIIHNLELKNIHIPIKHCANTAATLLFPETYFDMVRVGIGLYGLCPSGEILGEIFSSKKFIQFYPALSWKSYIGQIKKIPKDSFIGYGCIYKTRRASVIAVIPVGYHDGYDRSLSNKSFVLICGKRAPVLGRICMNMMMVDVTDIPEVSLEDTVTLIGKDGRDSISAEELAELSGTIHYEVVSRIREGIVRKIVK